MAHETDIALIERLERLNAERTQSIWEECDDIIITDAERKVGLANVIENSRHMVEIEYPEKYRNDNEAKHDLGFIAESAKEAGHEPEIFHQKGISR